MLFERDFAQNTQYIKLSKPIIVSIKVTLESYTNVAHGAICAFFSGPIFSVSALTSACT